MIVYVGMADLNALIINCSLKKTGPSSTQVLLQEVEEILKGEGVRCTTIRVANRNIPFGTETNMGSGDDWPAIHELLLSTDIILIGTPIWLGQRCSVCQMMLERMDALIYETNEKGQLPLYGKVAGACVVGNEDGAQLVAAGINYNLMQMGATIPPQAEAYWVGEAGGKVDYIDRPHKSQYTTSLVQCLGHNLVHLAKMLKENPIPTKGNSK